MFMILCWVDIFFVFLPHFHLKRFFSNESLMVALLFFNDHHQFKHRAYKKLWLCLREIITNNTGLHLWNWTFYLVLWGLKEIIYVLDNNFGQFKTKQRDYYIYTFRIVGTILVLIEQIGTYVLELEYSKP